MDGYDPVDDRHDNMKMMLMMMMMMMIYQERYILHLTH